MITLAVIFRTPTCLLLNEKKDFEAFGYEAEKQYLSLVKENKQNKMFYFRRFKTKLFGNNVRTNFYISVVTQL